MTFLEWTITTLTVVLLLHYSALVITIAATVLVAVLASPALVALALAVALLIYGSKRGWAR